MIILQQQPRPRSSFQDTIRAMRREPLEAQGISTLQVNLGYRCNLSCTHCHVGAGPGRSEAMERNTVDAVIEVLARSPLSRLDITGGAPELNPHFRDLVRASRGLGIQTIVRTNLAVMHEPGMSDLPEFYARHDIEIVASLPCYRQENVDAVRGSGTFQKCIASLRTLNRLGFGRSGGRPLHLVYNPAGPFLPPLQSVLQEDYRRELRDRYDVSFTTLFALANMPIGRFREKLVRTGELDRYGELLACSFNPGALDGIMCRTLLSVGWDGTLYDCDFNQVLGLTVSDDVPSHIRDFSYDALAGRTVRTGDHCFGCTAGHGSSCTGSTV